MLYGNFRSQNGSKEPPPVIVREATNFPEPLIVDAYVKSPFYMDLWVQEFRNVELL